MCNFLFRIGICFLIGLFLDKQVIAQSTEQTIEDFIYRYRSVNTVISLNLTSADLLADNDDYYLGINQSLDFYYNDPLNNETVLISSYYDCFGYDNNSDRTIQINKGNLPNSYTVLVNLRNRFLHDNNSPSQFYHTRGLNNSEIRPEEISVKLKIIPFLYRGPVRSQSICHKVYQGISGSDFIALKADSSFFDIGVESEFPAEEIPIPECNGFLVPDYFRNCSKWDFSVYNRSSAGVTDPKYSFSFTHGIQYECYQPNGYISSFYSLATEKALDKNLNIHAVNNGELAEFSQVFNYCNTSSSVSPGISSLGCSQSSHGILTKHIDGSGGIYTYSRMLHDIVGHDYFVFGKTIDYLQSIETFTNLRIELPENDIIKYDDNLFHNNNRNCNGVRQFILLDRTATSEDYHHKTDFNNLVEWDILMSAEPYYGDETVPAPDVAKFFPIYRIRKNINPATGNYINSSSYVVNIVNEGEAEKYFEYDLEGVRAIFQQTLYNSNFYQTNSNSIPKIGPPIKLFYQDLRDEQGRKPLFIRYQFMESHTYEDLRPDSLKIGRTEDFPRFLTFQSDILTEMKAFPDITNVELQVAYPCKNDISMGDAGALGKGTITITEVEGGRPDISTNYFAGHGYELYGRKFSCETLELFEKYLPNVIPDFLAREYWEYKSARLLSHSGLRLIPGAGIDYNYNGTFTNLDCGVYWIRAVTNNFRRPRPESVPFNYYRHAHGWSSYDINPWNEPIVITAKDVAPVRLTYLPSICNDAPYLLQAEAPDDYVSNIDYWKWEPPKLLDGSGIPVTGEAADEDKKHIFPGHTFCDQYVTGVYENGCISTTSIEVPDFSPPLLDAELLQNVLQISATKMRATWVKDFVDERFDDADGYRAMIEKDLFSTGQLGSYKIRSVHDYLDERVQTNTGDIPLPALNSDGVINDVASFNWTHPRFETTFPKWVNNGRVLKYNTSGQAIESIDLMDNFAAAIFGFDGSIPVGVAVNSRNREIGFEGFEEYPASGTVTPLNNMQGNLDLYNLQEEVTLEKYHTYNILAGSGRYVLTDIPEGKYTEDQLKRVIIEVEVPAQTSGEVIDKKSRSAVYTMSAGVVKDFCYDYGLMLELPENIYDAAERCEYWQGQIHLIEEIEVEEEQHSNIKIVKDIAHTGNRSLKIEPCHTAPVTMKQNVLELSEGKKYIISAWIKTTGSELLTPNSLHKRFNEKSIGIELKFDLGISTVSQFLLPNGVIVEGWQKLEHEFTYPEGSENLSFVFRNSDDFYLDDIRIFPKEGNMQTYVYDPSTYRVEATLDQNNFATIYKYDDEGKLFQVKKETAEGIKTLQVNQSYLQPKP